MDSCNGAGVDRLRVLLAAELAEPRTEEDRWPFQAEYRAASAAVQNQKERR